MFLRVTNPDVYHSFLNIMVPHSKEGPSARCSVGRFDVITGVTYGTGLLCFAQQFAQFHIQSAAERVGNLDSEFHGANVCLVVHRQAVPAPRCPQRLAKNSANSFFLARTSGTAK
jgi:hypothetical protein